MGANDEVGPWLRRAEEDEPCLSVLRKIAERSGLVPFPRTFHARRAGDAPALQAHRGEVETFPVGGNQDKLILCHRQFSLPAIRKDQGDGMSRGRDGNLRVRRSGVQVFRVDKGRPAFVFADPGYPNT